MHEDAGGAAQPLISVVIPTKNRRDLLGRALRSVFAQDYPRVEVIVVDAESTDGTLEFLASVPNPMRVVSAPDSGPFEAIERGWELSSGEILTWLNDDDLWLPGAAATVARHFVEHPQASVIYGSCAGIDLAGRVIWFETAQSWSLERAVIQSDHIINQPAAFIRRDAASGARGLIHEWVHDHDLWIRLGVEGAQFLAVPETLAAVRIHAGNHSMEPRFALAQKKQLIESWLSSERLPREIRRRARRARSNVYLRGLHYLDPGTAAHWLLGARWLFAAIAMDPKNTVAVVARGPRLAAKRFRRRSVLAASGLPDRLGEE